MICGGHAGRLMLPEVMTLKPYHTTQHRTDFSCIAATACGTQQSLPHHGLLQRWPAAAKGSNESAQRLPCKSQMPAWLLATAAECCCQPRPGTSDACAAACVSAGDTPSQLASWAVTRHWAFTLCAADTGARAHPRCQAMPGRLALVQAAAMSRETTTPVPVLTRWTDQSYLSDCLCHRFAPPHCSPSV